MVLYDVCFYNSIAFSQNSGNLSGTIVDETGEPIIGVSILVKGTAMGTVTDFDGNFSLQLLPVLRWWSLISGLRLRK